MFEIPFHKQGKTGRYRELDAAHRLHGNCDGKALPNHEIVFSAFLRRYYIRHGMRIKEKSDIHCGRNGPLGRSRNAVAAGGWMRFPFAFMERSLFFLTAVCWSGPVWADTPMSYLRTFGPAADPVTVLTWGLISISAAVCIIIAALILLGSFRRRGSIRPDPEGRLPVGPASGGTSWIYIGAGISSLVLFGSALWTIVVLAAVALPHRQAKLTIEVTGHQWWWEMKYLGDTPADTVITANELHIPVGEPVRLKLIGGDVIHSFWVPQLAGKTDMIPGQTSFGWLQADKAGDYRGQCGEYCGVQHAHMALHVIAEDRSRFESWRQAQLKEARAPTDAVTLQGGSIFMSHCSACHAVRGSGAEGALGPDLTHLMSRNMIASGTLSNNTGDLSGWVADAQALKPGSRMPAMNLSPQELRAVVSYLQTLQ